MKCTITTPAAAPITWEQIKRHLRLDGRDEETYVMELVDAAVSYAQTALGMSLGEQEITLVCWADDLATGRVLLPRGPVITIDSVTDDDDAALAEGDNGWKLEAVGNVDQLVITGSYEAPLTIVYTAGHATAAEIPAEILQAVKVHVGTLFEQRESVSEKSLGSVPDSLAAFYRLRSRETGIG